MDWYETSVIDLGETLEILLEKVDGIQDHGIQPFNIDSCGVCVLAFLLIFLPLLRVLLHDLGFYIFKFIYLMYKQMDLRYLGSIPTLETL